MLIENALILVLSDFILLTSTAPLTSIFTSPYIFGSTYKYECFKLPSTLPVKL